MKRTHKNIALLLRTAGDESRLSILCALFASKNACVSDVAEKVGMSIASVSHHLKVMEHNGILNAARDGKRICYRLSDESVMRDLKNLICKYT